MIMTRAISMRRSQQHVAAEDTRTASRAFAIWASAAGIAMVADVAATLPALALGMPEQNPLYPFVLALPGHMPWLWMLLSKVPVLLVLLWTRRTFRFEFPRATLGLAILCCLYNLLLASKNLVIVLLALHIL